MNLGEVIALAGARCDLGRCLGSFVLVCGPQSILTGFSGQTYSNSRFHINCSLPLDV